MTYKEERLEILRSRISMLRHALADPSMLTNLSIDGVSETFNRADARAELKELEAEYDRLTGASRRVYGIKLQ